MCARLVRPRGAFREGSSKVLDMIAILLLHQFVRSISRFFLRRLCRAKRDEETEDRAALVLRLERAADIAERACLAREHVHEGVHEQAVEVARLNGKPILEGGQMQVVERVQRGTPFHAGLYIVLFLLQGGE